MCIYFSSLISEFSHITCLWQSFTDSLLAVIMDGRTGSVCILIISHIKILAFSCISYFNNSRVSLVLFPHIDAELSVIASFNDTRCGYGGVCSTDPLFFTCNITGSPATVATVALPSGDVIVLNEDNSIQGMIPEGYTLQSAIVSMNDALINFILTFSIESASLLNGSDIICNSALVGGIRMAGCPVAGKFSIMYSVYY